MHTCRELLASRPRLWVWAHRLTANPVEADDLVQDTLERALRGADRRRHDDNVPAWLRTILYRRFVDLRRSHRKEMTVDAGWFDEVPVASAEPLPRWRSIAEGDVARALQQIPEAYRETYLMFAEQGRTYGEIAAHFGIDLGTVGSRISRTRRRLRELLEAQLEEGP